MCRIMMRELRHLFLRINKVRRRNIVRLKAEKRSRHKIPNRLQRALIGWVVTSAKRRYVNVNRSGMREDCEWKHIFRVLFCDSSDKKRLPAINADQAKHWENARSSPPARNTKQRKEVPLAVAEQATTP